MQVVVRSALFAALLCACHGTDSAAPDATSGPDAPPGASGLHVTWATSPVIPPGTTGGNVTVQSLRIKVDSLRVIGDAGPGDPRTSKTGFDLVWDSDHHPDPIDFPDAPTGLYSKVAIQADGHLTDDSYDITGTVVVSGTTEPFVIHDLDALTANIDLSTTLDPGTGATIPILVRLDDALGVIDFATLNYDDGKLELDTFDAQMPAFREKLATSFVLGDDSSN